MNTVRIFLHLCLARTVVRKSIKQNERNVQSKDSSFKGRFGLTVRAMWQAEIGQSLAKNNETKVNSLDQPQAHSSRSTVIRRIPPIDDIRTRRSELRKTFTHLIIDRWSQSHRHILHQKTSAHQPPFLFRRRRERKEAAEHSTHLVQTKLIPANVRFQSLHLAIDPSMADLHPYICQSVDG